MNSFIEDEFIDMTFLQDQKSYQIVENGVTKYEQKEWDTPMPYEGCKCTIKYEGRKLNGQLIDHKRDRNQFVNVKIFNDDHIQGIHYALSQMHVGESAWFEITPSFYIIQNIIILNMKKITLTQNIPTQKKPKIFIITSNFLISQSLKRRQFTIHLKVFMNFIMKKKQKAMNFLQKATIQLHTNVMNVLQMPIIVYFFQNQFPKPVKYTMSNSQKSNLFYLLAQLLSNSAQCELNLKHPNEAVDCLKNAQKYIEQSKSIFQEPENSDFVPQQGGDYLHSNEPIDYSKCEMKIFYRYGEAFYQKNDYSTAQEWFIKSGDSFKIQLCAQKLKEFKQKEKKFYQKVLENMENEKQNEKKQEKIKRSLQKIQDQKANEQNMQQEITLQQLKHGHFIDAARMEDILGSVNQDI